MANLSKPLLVFDGNCGFCRLWIDRWKHLTADRVDYAPFQEAAGRFPNIPLEQFRSAVQLIEPSGAVTSGAQAVFRLLAYGQGKRWLNWLYDHAPGFAPVSEACYRFVAQHRPLLYRLSRLLWGSQFERPSNALTRRLFLRILAIIYVIAFLSLGVQITGLVGSQGVLPASHLLDAVRSGAAEQRYWALPTLAWLSASDGALRAMCFGGVAISAAGFFGILPPVMFAAAWALYLSLVVIGQDFLSFQWDILLLETGFLAIFFAPWQLRAGSIRREPSRAILWLLRILLFRLMFSSGAVKLTSGDPTWRSLRALDYHYQTQPLPTPLAWLMQQLPHGFQTLSVLVMFGIELVAPFFLFAPRRVRLWAAGLIAFLQALILLTGNYAFFNLLALALCLVCLDDAFLHRFFPRRAPPERILREPRLKRAIVAVLFVVILFAGAEQAAGVLGFWGSLPRAAMQIFTGLGRFYIVNSYGLFAVMTTTRYEIIVEGSNDGQTWLPYEFKYKPGDIKRRPPIVEPHQPRLDWQMWFAALGDYRDNPWFVNFMVRLLEGSPQVLALLAKNPFPGSPPRYIRAELYDYRFTDFAEWRATGAWWRREFVRLYFPVASLRSR
ncbi:MAG TPA: lipase maturation factor family protein [Bryobacterales bacterium]|nr:lipase maturation factor family protein [Bryobacterales bacterium]